MKKKHIIEIKCHCSGKHSLLMENGGDGEVWVWTKGDCDEVVVFGEELEKMKKFIKSL